MPNMRRRHTKSQQRAESIIGGPLADTLPPIARALGLVGAATKLGVSKSTIENWLAKIGCQRVWVLLGPREEIILQDEGLRPRGEDNAQKHLQD